MPPVDPKDPKAVVTRAKSIATRAINKAAIAKTSAPSRSTGTRAEYKIKAEALDEIAALLGSGSKRGVRAVTKQV